MSVSLTKKLCGEGTNGTDKLVVCVGLMVRAHTHEKTSETTTVGHLTQRWIYRLGWT
jgi:hypothetical protein